MTNARTATYQVLASDFSVCKTITVASGTFTITLVASGSQPANGQCINVINYGTGVVTVARSGQNINGGTASLILPSASATAPVGAFIVSDGTNYFASMFTSQPGWRFLGTATGATTTVGPVVWTGTYQQFMVKYIIAGYNGGTPVGRILFGAASISTTAATNATTLQTGSTTPVTTAVSIPGAPLASLLAAIRRSGTMFVDGASGSFKTYEILGQSGDPSVSSVPVRFTAAGQFSDLGSDLPLQRMQLTVYDTLTTTTVSSQTFLTGTYISVWGKNND